jgi:hypothetical protein
MAFPFVSPKFSPLIMELKPNLITNITIFSSGFGAYFFSHEKA